MLGRIAKGGFQIGGAVLGGVLADRVNDKIGNKHPETAPSEAGPRPPPLAGTGNERLRQIAERQRRAPDSNMVTDGVQAAIDSRTSVIKKTINVAQNADQVSIQFQEMLKDLGDEAKVAMGAAKVISGTASLTSEDGVEIATTAAKETTAHVMEHLKNFDPAAAAKAVKKGADTTYAVATTTREGVQEAIDVLHDKAQQELGGVAVGMAASQTVAAVLQAFPHPAAKAAGVAVGLLGNAAAGAKLSEVLRNTSGTAEERESATRQKVNEILTRKAAE
jgi:hypothetical protein